MACLSSRERGALGCPACGGRAELLHLRLPPHPLTTTSSSSSSSTTTTTTTTARPVCHRRSQPLVLAFECLFPVILIYGSGWVETTVALFGVSFHLGCMALFHIDFVRFWLPA